MQPDGLKIESILYTMQNILLALLLIISTSCKTGKHNKPETAHFELRKTPCFGTCPEFTMTFDLSGKALYTGLTNVTKKGDYSKTFKPEEVRKAIDAFEAANFWGFNDKYVDQGVSDMPSTYIYFEHNGRTKRIEDQFNSPKELKALERLLEDMANSEGWQQTGQK
jgi:hypothetical protein